MNKIYEHNVKITPWPIESNSVDCIVTSPPYWGLRDYGHADQIGQEETPEDFVKSMVAVFTEGSRVLKPEGTLWLNLGDSYSTSSMKPQMGQRKDRDQQAMHGISRKPMGELKSKDLVGIPWMVAFALRSAGWYLRQDIIWSKPNAMPESVTDRCTKSHEYIFLLSKSDRYYYDHEAIKTEALIKENRPSGVERNREYNYDSKENNHPDAYKRPNTKRKYTDQRLIGKKLSTSNHGVYPDGTSVGGGLANKRSVWTVNTMPYSGAHFATFPERLIIDCIKAGCAEGGIVLDPFMGAGTTAVVAKKLNRNFIGLELNPDYIKIAETRLKKEIGMFL